MYAVIPKKGIRKIIFFVAIGFIIFAIADIIYNKGVEFDSFASGIESIIIILLCVYYLFVQIRGANNLLLYSTLDFWVVIAFLIYFSGTFFLYLMTDNMKGNPSFQKIYFIINISFNILKNLLLCVAMTMKLNNPKESSSLLPDLDDNIFHKKQ